VRPSVQIILVSYHVVEYLRLTLYAARVAAQAYGSDRVELWVVDNASADASVAMVQAEFPEVQLIANVSNVGFSRANNQAITQSHTDYILLLNPDTVLPETALLTMVDYLESHPEAGAVGPRMVDGLGNFLPESKRALPTPAAAFFKLFGLAKAFPKHLAFGQYNLHHLPENEVQAVEVLQGACQLIRRSAYHEVGGLDNDYFMFGEDVDLSYKLLRAGHLNVYLPEVTVPHYKGRSSRREALGHVWRFYSAMQRFAHKHIRPTVNPLWYAVIVLGIWVRGAVSGVARAGLPGLELILFYTSGLAIEQAWQRLVTYPDGGGYPAVFVALVLPFYSAAYVLGLWLSRAYVRPYTLRPVGYGVGIGLLAVVTVTYLLPSINFSRVIVLTHAATVLFLALSLRRLLVGLAAAVRKLLVAPPARIALAGTPDGLRELQTQLAQASERISIVATYSDADLDTLVERVALLRPTWLAVAISGIEPSRVQLWREGLRPHGIGLATYVSGGSALILPDRIFHLG
jgi:GT2 family glycosyltransferase